MLFRSGETAAGSMVVSEGAGTRPARTTIEQDTLAEDQPKSSRLATIGLVEAARSNLVSSRPTQSAIVQDAKVEDRSEPARLETIGLVEASCSKLINSRPTQTALGQEITVEQSCRSTWLSQVLEMHSSHFVPLGPGSFILRYAIWVEIMNLAKAGLPSNA